MVQLDTYREQRWPEGPKPAAPGRCHDCGHSNHQIFYRLSRFGYNVCPTCFQWRVESFLSKGQDTRAKI